MTWFKFKDTAPDHPKVKALTDKAFRWWVIGLSYASRYLTNGVLPKVFWIDVPKQVRAELSDGRLWDWIDPHFQIHDYEQYQTLREDVDEQKARNREKSKRYRDSKKASRVTSDATSDALPKHHGNVTTPENREQITENREQTTTAPPSMPPRPLISGESNPRTWGKIHGEHVPGFCDWVCLPEFVFAEFARKSAREDASEAYVREWAHGIRVQWEGEAIGDNLKFWRGQWDASHPVAKPAKTAAPVPTKAPSASPDAVQEALETRRRRAEMTAQGMSPDAIEAVFEREYQQRKSGAA